MIKVYWKNKISIIYRKIQFLYYSFTRVFRKKFGLIIIGCGRSGTTYTSKKLKSLGFDIGHERLKRDGITSWYLVSDQSKVPFGPNFNQIKKLNLPIVHQVRHPLKSISSIQAIGKPNWKFLSNEIPINYNKDSKILRSMKYWYYWNLKAEKKAAFTYRIENFDNVLPDLLEMANFPYQEGKFSIDKKTNTREHTHLTWEDLENENKELAQKIKRLGKKYGYEI